jgi:hypothetical protein
MSAPKRIQRKRTKGWRMPEGAVYVGRPTRWGNPWSIGSTEWFIEEGGLINREPHEPLTREQAIKSFSNSMSHDGYRAQLIREALAGKDLACWCPLDSPCHGDVLLDIANRDDS